MAFGPLAREKGLGAHGTHYPIADAYDELAASGPLRHRGTERSYPSLRADKEVCDIILSLATVTNGEMAYRSYKEIEEKTGLPSSTSSRRHRGARTTYKDSRDGPYGSSTARCGPG